MWNTSIAMSGTGPGAVAMSRRSNASQPGCGATPISKAITSWMRDHNRYEPLDRRPGFYGLDIYNMSESIGACSTISIV